MWRLLTLAAGAAVWGVCAWLLWRTSVPSLDLSGFDPHRWFTARELRRAHGYSRGEQALWLGGTAATLIALGVCAWRLPRTVRSIGLGRIGAAIIAGMVLMTVLWAVSLPFSLADLWWQHHWGLGPFSVAAWFDSQWSTLGAEAVSVMLSIVVLVGFANRFRRGWWLVTGPLIVVIAAAFAFASGYLERGSSVALHNRQLAADVARIERAEHVTGTPVREQKVSSFTNQVNAFTTGFGPSTTVVLWNTLLDGRFSRSEEDAVIAHELGHVRSRHILKAIGWSALVVLPTLWVLSLATRRRGGLRDPANLPYAFLVLAILALVTAPVQNAVSRRYEAEADWRSLNATHDPAATAKLFEKFATTSLEEPSPPLWDYLWLENHPTLQQRIAMAVRWRQRHGGR
jgi:STE24 endopeptidase